MINSVTGSISATELYEEFSSQVDQSIKERKLYSEKLESASGDDIFKYILLINVAEISEYVNQTRLQAQQSFFLCRTTSIIGFAMLSIGIILGTIAVFIGNNNMNASYISSIAGVITEFTSGVFFLLFNSTLRQINRFHDKLISVQQSTMAYLTVSTVSDESKRDMAKVDVSKRLMPVQGKQADAV